MLVRVNSGAEGVADYLETGRKRGREFDRDLIDERLVLDGDLALMDAVIDSIETAQEGDAKYLHITLGLTERFTTADVCGPDEVNLAKLKEITDAYREALMAAYGREEYAWYAEAHIPKVTHELHESTGEYVARLPHVHIVLPMRNLEDGKYLNPFGFGKSTIDYAQAIQEQINERFGLASPLDSPRDAPHNALAKHNPRLAPTTPKELRAAALEILRDGRAKTFDELADQLAELGQVRVRRGKDGDYLNVKPAWADKGINLKDLGRDQFAQALEAARASAPAPAQTREFDQLVAQWVEQGAHEARYVTSANRAQYKQLEPAQKREWLVQKIQATRERLQARERDWTSDGPNAGFIETLEVRNERTDQSRNRFATARDAWRAAARLLESGPHEAAPGQPPQTLAGVRHLSGIDLVQHQRTASMLLHADAPDRLDQDGKAGDEVRRARVGDLGAPGGRRPITVAETLLAARQRSGPDPDRLKADTSPSIVLETAARLFKLDRSKYDVGSGRDGTPRIIHADRQYNLGDFFTKHLNVPWESARSILTDCYHATLSDGLPPPDRELWRSFSAWREQSFRDRREALDRAKAQNRSTLVDARDVYKRAKINARALPWKERQALMAQARARRLVAQETARELLRQQREISKRPSRNAQYREFLTDLANRGNLAALGELRRAAPVDREPFDGVTGSKSKPVLPLPSYKVDHLGRVTYYRDEHSIVTDSTKGVAVLRREQAAYDTALKVAVARYGKNLTLRGDRVFVDNMIAAARRSGLDLTIRNAEQPRAAPVQIRAPERGR